MSETKTTIQDSERLSAIKQEIAKLYQQMAKETIEQDKRMKKKGATYKLEYWIHPTEGDDYQEESYLSKKPNAEELQRLLKRRLRKSIVKDDYQLIKLG